MPSSSALIARAALRMMHVAADAEDMHWSDFPGVRATLARWGLLPGQSARGGGAARSRHWKSPVAQGGPVGVLLHYLDAHPAELVVLATHQRAGMARWLHRAVAEPVARYAGAMTLFLPQDVAGFIALDNGTVTLQRAYPHRSGAANRCGCSRRARAHPGLSLRSPSPWCMLVPRERCQQWTRPRHAGGPGTGRCGAGRWSSRFLTSARPARLTSSC